MPHYHFHIYNDVDVFDEEGQEQADDAAAMNAAEWYARDLAAADVRSGHLDLRHFIACTSQAGRRVGIVRFGDVVRVLG